ncbi:MAG: ParB/RepB/Spo0J family partition protein [Clostridia bacterium]|nr:ParB/RepB/Spo0J family partition protein [Clostridia bacterium]
MKKYTVLNSKEESENPGDVIKIPVKAIRCGNVSFGETGKKFRALVKSIEKSGTVTPVCVVKTKRGKYDIIAGKQRFIASIRAGLKEIPAIICSQDGEHETMLSIISEMEGILNFFEEGDYFKKIIDSGAYTQKALAERIGKSQSYISNKLRLIKMPPAVRKKITDGKLTERHARAILKIDDEKLQRLIVDLTLEKQLSAEETEARISELVEASNQNLSKNYVRLTERFKKEQDKIKGNTSDAQLDPEVNAERLRLLIKSVKELVEITSKNGLRVIAGQRNTDKNVEIVIKVPRAENEVTLKSGVSVVNAGRQGRQDLQKKEAA